MGTVAKPPRIEYPSLSKDTESHERIPAGITINPRRSFNELPEDLKAKVRQGEASLEEAWERFEPSSGAYHEGAHSLPFAQEVRTRAMNLAESIFAQNNVAQDVGARLSKDERYLLSAAIANHLHQGKNLEGSAQSNTPSFSNLYGFVDTALSYEPAFLHQPYNLFQLAERATILMETEEKRARTHKFARDLLRFAESGTNNLAETDFSLDPDDTRTRAVLEELLAETAPTKWHEKLSALCEDEQTPQELAQGIRSCLAAVKRLHDYENAKLARPDPAFNGRINETTLALLNPEREPERIASFEVGGVPHELLELFTMHHLSNESDVLGHCVGEGPSYFRAIREGEIRIFSVRTKGTPLYTIEYTIHHQSIEQFKGGGDRPVNSLPEDSALPLAVFSALERAGIPLKSVHERFDYGIASMNDEYVRATLSSKEDILSYIRANPEGKILKTETLSLDADTTIEELNELKSIRGLEANFTDVRPEVKDALDTWEGSLIDTNSTCSYKNLTSISGGAYFDSLTSADGLSALTSISVGAYFRNLTSADGLSALTSISGGAYFDSLTNADGLSALTSISGDAYFDSLTNADGLSALTSISGDADFRSLPESEREKIPALRERDPKWR